MSGKNKEVVLISKTMVTAIVLIVAGLLFLGYSISKNGIINNATLMETMTEADLKEGTYVTGTIDTLLLKFNYQTATFSAVNQTEVGMLTESMAFTIPFGDGKYIRARISDISNQYVLKKYTGDKEHVQTYSLVTSTPIEFFGVVKKSSSINLDWYNEDKELLDVENIIYDMELVEVKKPNPGNYQYIGIALLAVGIILLVSRGSHISRVEAPKEEYRETYAKMQEENPTKSNTPANYYMAENPSWDGTGDDLDPLWENAVVRTESEEQAARDRKERTAEQSQMDPQAALEAERKARLAAKEQTAETLISENEEEHVGETDGTV